MTGEPDLEAARQEGDTAHHRRRRVVVLEVVARVRHPRALRRAGDQAVVEAVYGVQLVGEVAAIGRADAAERAAARRI